MEIENINHEIDYAFYKGLHPDDYADELKSWYELWSGKPLDLENPQTFNEKIQWLKLYDSTPLKTRLADKHLVRDWVRERVGEKYLIPLLGTWDKFDDIDFDRLPDKFVLKANHGCGWNIIVKDKSSLDKAAAKREFSKWLNTNFAFINGLELHYKDISPKIIAEEIIENEGMDLYDYKIWCFNGEPELIMLLAERQVGLKMAFYDLAWNLLPFTYTYPQYKKLVTKPDNLDEMIHIAKKLCRDYIHVRVDLYRLDDGSLKFGEMTFTTASGQCMWNPPEYDFLIGRMTALPDIERINPMSKRRGIKNFLKTSLATLAKTFNRKIVPVISSIMEEKQTIRDDDQEEKKQIEFDHDDAEAIGLVPRTIINFSVPLVEHCNLKCCGCDHFAPVAEQTFADINVFKNDFARLSELLNGEAVKIGLMGGEPLLHPQVKDFLYIARHYFPKTRIRIVSNGVLMLKQKEDFWKACKENDIIIEITKYPINLDFDKMKEMADSYSVTLEFRDDTGELQKTSYHIPLDLEGRQDARKNFMKCFHANVTIFLTKGRLYTCTVAPNISHFNKYFNIDLPTSAKDSIDIYKTQSAQELFEFLSKPIPFCRYCYVDKRTFGIPWKRSRKDMKEWTV